jgi:hypothetical protein
MGIGLRFAPILVPVAVAYPALAEVSDKLEESQPAVRIITGLVLLLLAIAATSHWRRALLLWPLALLWGWALIDEAWEWGHALRREGALGPLWSSVWRQRR